MTALCVCCNVASVSIATRFLLSSTCQHKVLSMTGLTGNHSTAARVFARVSFVHKPISPPNFGFLPDPERVHTNVAIGFDALAPRFFQS